MAILVRWTWLDTLATPASNRGFIKIHKVPLEWLLPIIAGAAVCRLRFGMGQNDIHLDGSLSEMDLVRHQTLATPASNRGFIKIHKVPLEWLLPIIAGAAVCSVAFWNGTKPLLPRWLS
jgi:hypothetical protein